MSIEIPEDKDIAKALRPEVTREQMYAIIEHLHEAIEAMLEVPEDEEDASPETETEDDSAEMETEDANSSNPMPVGDPNKNPINWPISKAYEDCGCETCKANNTSCDKCEECMSKGYDSENEEEDNWDNLKKACWEGYTQRGMKDKGGRMVPNCVPVKKMYKSIWGGTFLK